MTPDAGHPNAAAVASGHASRKTRILVVDDDTIQLIRLKGVLGALYEVVTLDRAAMLAEEIARFVPDLLILDIELPDGNGIDLCRQLRANGHTALPIVFHSSHDTIDNRMEAYQAGGDDFFLKSMTADELLVKLGILLDWASRNRALEHERESAREDARRATSNLGEVGIVLEAIRQAGMSTDLHTLGTVGVDALSDLRIDAIVQVKVGKDKMTLSPRGHATPLEVSIIHNSRLSGRVFQFQDRLVLNFSNTSIFVRNFPNEQPTQAQRARDMASVIGEGLNARAHALEIELALDSRNQLLTAANEQAEQALYRLDTAWTQRKHEAEEAMTRLRDGLERDFLALSLSKREEDRCLATVQRYISEVARVFEHLPSSDPVLNRLRADLLASQSRSRVS
ncbi:MAG: response regulator [Burkholderiales bacterium]|nr:response regulator [Burkholderiales bacterium]